MSTGENDHPDQGLVQRLRAAAVAVLAGVTACAGSSSTPPAAGSSVPGRVQLGGLAVVGQRIPAQWIVGQCLPPEPSTVPAELQGNTFVATEVTGSYTIAPGSSITLTFRTAPSQPAPDATACRERYVIKGDVLVAPTLASTMMACEEALMEQDTWFAAFLASSPTWTYADGTLTLTNGTDTVDVHRCAQRRGGAGRDRMEAGRADLQDRVPANTVTAVDPSLTAWLRFNDTDVVFNNSCNSGGGSAEITDSTIVFGPLRSTLIFCDGPAGQTEAAMNAVLQGTTSYTLTDDPSGGLLVIMSTDGTSGLQLTADPGVGADAFSSASGSAPASAIKHTFGLDKPFLSSTGSSWPSSSRSTSTRASSRRTSATATRTTSRSSRRSSTACRPRSRSRSAARSCGCWSASRSGSSRADPARHDRSTGWRWAPRSSRSRRPSTGSGSSRSTSSRNDIGQIPHLRRRRQLRRRHLPRPDHVVPSLILPWIVLAAAFAAIYARFLRGEPDRDDARGLHPHGARQGPRERTRDLPPRRALGDHADRHDPRPRPRHPARRRHPHGVGLQHPRASAASPSTRSRRATCRRSRAPCSRRVLHHRR